MYFLYLAFSENENRHENCENEADRAKVARALTYYFPGDMSYNDVSQSISLLKLKKGRKCDESSDDKSPSEIDRQQKVNDEQTDDPLSLPSTTEVQAPATVDQVEQRPQGRRRPRKQKLLDRGDDEMVFVPKWKVEAEEQSAYMKRNRSRSRKKSRIVKRNMHLNKLRMKRRMKAKRKVNAKAIGESRESRALSKCFKLEILYNLNLSVYHLVVVFVIYLIFNLFNIL